MELKVDLGKKPTNITTLEFLVLAFHDHLTLEDFEFSDESLLKLQESGYIKVTDSSEGFYDLRAQSLEFKAVPLVTETAIKKKVKEVIKVDWIDEYRNLFKAKSSAKGVMGSRTQCIHKMKKFIKDTGATKDEIIKATELYLHSLQDIRYLQQADYFISKNGGSRLEAFIEEYKDSNPASTFYEEI